MYMNKPDTTYCPVFLYCHENLIQDRCLLYLSAVKEYYSVVLCMVLTRK